MDGGEEPHKFYKVMVVPPEYKQAKLNIYGVSGVALDGMESQTNE